MNMFGDSKRRINPAKGIQSIAINPRITVCHAGDGIAEILATSQQKREHQQQKRCQFVVKPTHVVVYYHITPFGYSVDSFEDI